MYYSKKKVIVYQSALLLIQGILIFKCVFLLLFILRFALRVRVDTSSVSQAVQRWVAIRILAVVYVSSSPCSGAPVFPRAQA